ncbi:MAG: hypothetical protein KJ623_02350 [Nanoarchaeota archaeon]|nr:hypothetical protein [Nanoarchaeota archaeon]MBU0962658.1 hypothetical protein [Nanoarchaeota archaeon]
MELHKDELLKKSGIDKENFNIVLQLILKKVMIVPNDILLPFKEDALNIIKNIDINDINFIACALAYPDSIIWSDDKKLKEQTKIKIINTKEIIELLRGY